MTTFLKNVPAIISKFPSLTTNGEMQWTGGTDADGYSLATADSLRDGKLTHNATPVTAHTIAISVDKQLVRVICEVLAKREDVIGDAAYFVVRAVYLRNGSSLSAVSAPEVIKSASTGSATTWAAALSASSTNVLLTVTGEAAKDIHWSVLREEIIAI